MFLHVTLLSVLALASCKSIQYRNSKEILNNRPTIAILAQITPTDIHQAYIAASYVKYVESAGARAVLIPSNFSESEVAELFTYVNGVLFPGGSINWFTSGYYKHAKVFYDLAIQANKNGDYFPIWGTCLGFETLHVLTAKSSDILSDFSADDITITLNFTEQAPKSKIFKDMPMNAYKIFASENVTYNHHQKGISPSTYNSNPILGNFFNIISTNYGLMGREFISMVEAYNYPIYGSQWHPEKNNFEFAPTLHISHTEHAILASQYMANFFVNEARRSQHKFPTKQMEEKYLSYNYNPIYSGKIGGRLGAFEQIYVFPA